MQVDQQQQPPTLDTLSQIQNALQSYTSQMISSVNSISVRAGPVRMWDSEPDFTQSTFEDERKRHQGIEPDFNNERNQVQINQQATLIMDTYKNLQHQITSLDDDFNQDEGTLLAEL